MRMPEITKVGHGAAETSSASCNKHCKSGGKRGANSRVIVAIYGV